MNRTISNLIFFPEKGELLHNKRRYIILRPETLIRFQKKVEKALGPMSSELMFEAAHEIGLLIGKRLMEDLKLTQQEKITFMLDGANDLGWAKICLKENQQVPNKLILEAYNSAFASAYLHSEAPVCHLIRGIFCGALEQIIGPVIENREIQCLAMGYSKCVFEYQIQGPIHLQKVNM